MTMNTLDTALALTDRDLLARVNTLAAAERETVADLVAHLAALDLRSSLYAAQGYGSLFEYCTRALRLSEDAACSRIRAARTCRAFPMVLDLLSSGAVSLTTIRLLQPHLTAENHEAVLARATHKRREDVERLVAELAPKRDVPATMRKLPVSPPPQEPSLPLGSQTGVPAPEAGSPTASVDPQVAASPATDAGTGLPPPTTDAGTGLPPPTGTMVGGPGASIRPSAPDRYRVQFTISEETREKVRRLQALMRPQLPSGDPAVIFDRAVDLMLQKAERAKLGAGTTKAERVKLGARTTGRGRSDTGAGGAYENRIRFRTDKGSRHIPNAVKRAVWRRDGGRCAFVSAAQNRCAERSFLQFHHRQPYALAGPATVGNVALRCRRHNAYEAEVDFGPRKEGPPNTPSLPPGPDEAAGAMKWRRGRVGAAPGASAQLER